MTIASLPVISQPTISSQVIGTAVLAKSLDTVKTAGQSMIKMMEQSVTPDLGQNIDARV
ncbi:MAG: YjfB family protein [Mobilitalea sp.]